MTHCLLTSTCALWYLRTLKKKKEGRVKVREGERQSKRGGEEKGKRKGKEKRKKGETVKCVTQNRSVKGF